MIGDSYENWPTFYFELVNTIGAASAPDADAAKASFESDGAMVVSGPYATQDEAMDALVRTHPDYAEAAKRWRVPAGLESTEIQPTIGEQRYHALLNRVLKGQKIKAVFLNAFDDGHGRNAYAPIITLESGQSIYFSVRPTDSKERGVVLPDGLHGAFGITLHVTETRQLQGVEGPESYE